MQNRTPIAAEARPPLPYFTPAPRKYRHDGWTPERQKAFIAALAEPEIEARSKDDHREGGQDRPERFERQPAIVAEVQRLRQRERFLVLILFSRALAMPGMGGHSNQG